MCVCVCVCVRTLSHFSRVQLAVTLWTIAHQPPLFMEFSRQEYLSGLPCPLAGDFPDPGIKPVSFMSPALAGVFFTTGATWEALSEYKTWLFYMVYDNNILGWPTHHCMRGTFWGFLVFAPSLISWKPPNLRQIRTGILNKDLFLIKYHFKNSLST